MLSPLRSGSMNSATVVSMPEQIGRLLESRPACAWPECERAPDACVEYMQAPARSLPRAWLPPPAGVTTPCNRHAGQLVIELGLERIIRLTH